MQVGDTRVGEVAWAGDQCPCVRTQAGFALVYPQAGFASCGQIALPKAQCTDECVAFIWRMVCCLCLMENGSSRVKRPSGGSCEGRGLCCPHQLFRLRFWGCTQVLLCAHSWQQCHGFGTACAWIVSLQQENDYLQECLEAIQQDFVIFNREK